MATMTTQYKKFQHDVFDSAHKVFLAGLGTIKTVGDESFEVFDLLVDRGRDVETRGKKELDGFRSELKKRTTKATSKVENRFEKVGDQVDQQIANVLHRLGVPTRREIQTLTRRVEELGGKVDRLAGAPARAAAPAVERTVFHVSPHDEGWKLMLEGKKDPVSVHSTKDEAMTAAREAAKKAEPSQVVVHKMDGTIQSQFGYGEEAE
jgi:poly(hydroxyalkanoate) granule-associated protein